MVQEDFEKRRRRTKMAFSASSSRACVLLAVLLVLVAASSGGRIDEALEVTWGDGRGSVSPDGQVLTLSLDRTSGSGSRSRDTYLFARVDMGVKLVPNNSAGTVTTCYVRFCPISIARALITSGFSNHLNELFPRPCITCCCSSCRRARGTATTRWTSSSWAT
jgi:hypothetical protein